MSNFFGSIGNWFKNTAQRIGSGLNNFGQKVRGVIAKVGQGINNFSGVGRKLWGQVQNLPIAGDIIRASPLAPIVEKGLNIAQGIGGLGEAIGGRGRPIIDATKALISGAGYSPQAIEGKVRQSASNLISNILG
jgi:hypothetical protein